MFGLIYFYLSIILNIYILIAVYYFCIKIYGLVATLITNTCLSSMVLILILTGAYAVADLGTDLEVWSVYFLLNDTITIFTVFIMIFELARYSLKKSKGSNLSVKDLIIIPIVVAFYGIMFQMLIDPTASALGVYYYQNPPAINFFGFPIWFILSFSIYGLFAFIFLLFERHFFELSNKGT